MPAVEPPGKYPSETDILKSVSILPWIDEHFLRADPYAFKDVPGGFNSTKALIVEELDVDRNGIFCIGSGAVGFSLNPKKVAADGSLKKYDSRSDLDIAVVSEIYFETAWRDLRRATQPTVEWKRSSIRKYIYWQRGRLFDGAIVTSHLLSELSFGPIWLPAMVRIQQHVSILLDREVSIGMWIYRDYWSLRNYVSEGLMRCRKKAKP